jgi:ABC-type dipeptide/oligopeptide/nickel transport system ATPase subunit
MVISWMDFSIADCIKPFSISLEEKNFLFLAGETCRDKLLRALAGFLPKECNSRDSIRISGQFMKSNSAFKSMLLPKNVAESFPPHRTIGDFALDLSPVGTTKKKIESCAAAHGIEKHFLHSKPSKIPSPILQKISLWLCSLNTSAVIFVEEPEGGFFDECRPFDFLQSLLKNGTTGCIVYSTDEKDIVLQKAKAMQFCTARIAIFCADRLVEEGVAARMLENPIHSYTREWFKFGSKGQRKNGSLWLYCPPDCQEQYNCPIKKNISPPLWDYEPDGSHKVICKGFLSYMQEVSQ